MKLDNTLARHESTTVTVLLVSAVIGPSPIRTDGNALGLNPDRERRDHRMTFITRS
jgi:hypothetical protein